MFRKPYSIIFEIVQEGSILFQNVNCDVIGYAEVDVYFAAPSTTKVGTHSKELFKLSRIERKVCGLKKLLCLRYIDDWKILITLLHCREQCA